MSITPRLFNNRISVSSEIYANKFLSLRERTEELSDELFDFTVPNHFQVYARGTRCVQATQVLREEGRVVYSDENGNIFQEEARFPFHVHANFVSLVKGVKVICSQAPKQEHLEEFWKAVHHHTRLIVDLTTEHDRVPEYYPQKKNKALEFDKVTVTARGLVEDSLFKYSVNWAHSDREDCVEVNRLHFSSWPDRGTISPKELSTLVNKVNELVKDQFVWIHCRAGVGRSGTLTVALALHEMHRQGRLVPTELTTQIDELILLGRSQRDFGFVQNKEQYQLLHEYAMSLISSS